MYRLTLAVKSLLDTELVNEEDVFVSDDTGAKEVKIVTRDWIRVA